jgi:hypothetical protein
VVGGEGVDSTLHMVITYEAAKATGQDFFNNPGFTKDVIDYSLHRAKAGVRVSGVWKGQAEPKRYYPAIYNAKSDQYKVPEKNVSVEQWLRLSIHTDKPASDFKSRPSRRCARLDQAPQSRRTSWRVCCF